MSASTKTVHCSDCQHSKALHYPNGPHRCILDGCFCRRFVSAQEAAEVAKHIHEWLVLAAMVTPAVSSMYPASAVTRQAFVVSLVP